MEKNKGFAHKKVIFGGVLQSRGVVIRPNGELRAPTVSSRTAFRAMNLSMNGLRSGTRSLPTKWRFAGAGDVGVMIFMCPCVPIRSLLK